MYINFAVLVLAIIVALLATMLMLLLLSLNTSFMKAYYMKLNKNINEIMNMNEEE